MMASPDVRLAAADAQTIRSALAMARQYGTAAKSKSREKTSRC
jgi:hypothetical protein